MLPLCPLPFPPHPKHHWTLFYHPRNVTVINRRRFYGSCCLLFLLFICIRTFSRIVISGRKLGKVKERNEIKLKSPLFLRKLLVSEAADVSDLIADSKNGPLQHCTACVKHHRSPDCPAYVTILSSLQKQK